MSHKPNTETGQVGAESARQGRSVIFSEWRQALPPVNVLDLGKIKYVYVYVKDWQAPLIYTCYEQGEGVWKEEGGRGWTHVVQLVQRRGSDYEPRWLPTIPLEHIERVETISMTDFLKAKANV